MSDALREIYENATMWTEGTTWTYRGYEFRKVETPGLSPCHSEVAAYNPDGRKVESYTVGAFDSFGAFRGRVDRLIDYDPDDLTDWLTRDHNGEVTG